MDIILPYDENLEDQILGHVIMEPDLYDEIAPFITDLEVFYHTKARVLWAKLSNILERWIIDNSKRLDKIAEVSQ